MPRFDDALVEDIKARTSLVDMIGRDVTLKRAGREYVGLSPFQKERTPSFTVVEEKGFWKDFSSGESGDCFDWLMVKAGLTFVQAVEELAVRAGLMPDREGRVKPKAIKVADRKSREELDAEKAESVGWAWDIWQRCRPAAGTVVEAYLRVRGIDPERMPGGGLPPTIRFHPGLKHRYSGEIFPAMVAYVQRADRHFGGIHRTFLKPDGSDKAFGKQSKLMLGNCKGGYLRLCPAAWDMCTAEGIETAYSVMLSTGKPTWAALSEDNLDAPLPPIVKRLTICADNDTRGKENTKRRLGRAKASHAARGIRVSMAFPPEGMDFNDLLRAANP